MQAMTAYETVLAVAKQLSKEEQRQLGRELGLCTCTALADLAKNNPRVAVGAVLGALLGAATTATASNAPPTPATTKVKR